MGLCNCRVKVCPSFGLFDSGNGMMAKSNFMELLVNALKEVHKIKKNCPQMISWSRDSHRPDTMTVLSENLRKWKCQRRRVWPAESCADVPSVFVPDEEPPRTAVNVSGLQLCGWIVAHVYNYQFPLRITEIRRTAYKAHYIYSTCGRWEVCGLSGAADGD